MTDFEKKHRGREDRNFVGLRFKTERDLNKYILEKQKLIGNQTHDKS